MKHIDTNFKNMVFGMFGTSNKTPNVFLYFAALIVNIMSLVNGITFAWSSPVAPKLQSTEDNPLGIILSVNEISWLASILALGIAVGPFPGGYLADKFGRKNTLAVTAIPMIATFIILNYVHYLLVYYIIRFISGLCLGMLITVIPMYVGEIAEVHNRGTVGCFSGLLLAFGFLFSLGIGPYVSIFLFNWLCVVPSVIFLIIFTIFIPESPCYYIMTNRLEDAKKSLTKLRSRGEDVEEEFLELTTMVRESLANRKGIFDVFKTKHLLKSLKVMMTLMVILQFTGISIIIYYLQIIFEDANSSIPTDLCTVIIGIVQVIGTILSSIVVDKLGRRPLLLFSNVTTAIALLMLSVYFYMLPIRDMTSLGWIPLVTLNFYIFCSNIGMRPLPFAILGELFPPHIKPAASAISVSTCFAVSFIIVKVFPLLADRIGNWIAYLLLAICNGVGTFYIWYCIPETKGKTLTEIVDSFK